MRKHIASTPVVAQLLTLLLLTPSQPSEAAPQPHTSNVVSGSMNSEHTNKLTGEIRWHTSLGEAEQDARMGGKLIFWLNILGSLSGAT